MPENLGESRKNRLHHPCETNRNSYFIIETFENFYCIFYSSIETSIFGEVDVNINIDGEWEVEETGSDNFQQNATSISFSVSFSDAIIKVTSISDQDDDDVNNLPKITSVIVKIDNKSEEYCSNINCGKRGDSVELIINGKKVREGSWPWHAALYYRPEVTSMRFRCGSTIINKNTVITIATCLVTYDALLQERVVIDVDKLYVSVGETKLFDSSASTRQMLHVKEIKFHEKYSKEYRADGSYKDDYNIALLVLDNAIQYSLHVKPICLPESNEFDYDGKIGTAVGWGFSEIGDLQISKHLQDLKVPTYNFLTCMFRSLNRTIYKGFSATRNFCAGYTQDRGICTGDSGGGLYIEQNSKFYLYGLASYANCECIQEKNKCTVYGEGFFVNVAVFLPWIQNNMT